MRVPKFFTTSICEFSYEVWDRTVYQIEHANEDEAIAFAAAQSTNWNPHLLNPPQEWLMKLWEAIFKDRAPAQFQ